MLVSYALIILCLYIALNAEPPLPHQKTPPKIVSQKAYDQALYDWTQTLAEVLQLTSHQHYQLHEPDTCMSKAIDAFLTNLDPHSSFLPPEKYKKILQATSGTFYGVGIVIDNTRKTTDKFLNIVEVIPNGPADKAELKAGDKIIAIDGSPIEGMSTDEAISHLKGEKQTICEVKVVREGTPDMLSFSITRDIVKEQHSQSFYNTETQTYYISLTQFSESAIKQIQTLLQKEAQNKYKGLILDLRNNSGGLLQAAVDIASFFLEKGSLVTTTKDRTGKIIEAYRTKDAPIIKNNIPLFILINNYTASAAEILAGALKQYSEAASKNVHNSDQKQNKPLVFLIGTKTFGKGSVQDIIPISNNSAVKLTTALYYLPDDTTVQGRGIEPDLVVNRCFPPPENINWLITYFGREENFANHIKPKETKKQNKRQEHTKKRPKVDSNKASIADQAKQQLQEDSQYRYTLTCINIFNTVQKQAPQLVANRTATVNFLKNHCMTQPKITLEEVTQKATK